MCLICLRTLRVVMVVSINKTVESYLSACVIFLGNFHQQILCFINNIFGDLMYSFTCILSGTILCVFPLCNLHLMLGSVDIQMHTYMHYLALYNRIFLIFCLFVCLFIQTQLLFFYVWSFPFWSRCICMELKLRLGRMNMGKNCFF